MIYSFKLNLLPFSQIESHQKDIELRLYDEKRRVLKVGDYIIFYSLDKKYCLLTKIVKLYRYDNFFCLISDLGVKRLGISKAEDMYQYYSKEKIAEFGVLGIGISSIKKLVDVDYINEIINVDGKTYSFNEFEKLLNA